MRQKMVLSLGIIISLMLLNVNLSFSQTNQEEQITAPQAEPETLWLWGEVVSVDPQKNEILIKTPDYETDQEKEIAVIVDGNTVFENVASLSEIKPNDTVTIDYMVSSDGKNIAKNINLEKPETEPTPVSEPTPEATPEAAPETSAEEVPSQIP